MSAYKQPSRYLPGRPAYYADITFGRDPDQPLFDKFYTVTRSLSYREMIGLARTLGVRPVTIWRWKTGQTAPRYGVMSKVIEWGEQGKPLVKRQRDRYADGMF